MRYSDCLAIYKLGKTLQNQDRLSVEKETAVHIFKVLVGLCLLFGGMCSGVK